LTDQGLHRRGEEGERGRWKEKEGEEEGRDEKERK
jgi:hypothetical protein